MKLKQQLLRHNSVEVAPTERIRLGSWHTAAAGFHKESNPHFLWDSIENLNLTKKNYPEEVNSHLVKIPICGNKSKHTDHTVANQLTFVIAPDKGDNHCLFLSALEPIHRLDLQTWVLGCQALSQQLHLHHTSQATATWSAHTITSHHRLQQHGQLTPSHHSLQPLSAQAISSHWQFLSNVALKQSLDG